MDEISRLMKTLEQVHADAQTWEEVKPILDEISGAIQGLDAARQMLNDRFDVQVKTGAFEEAEKTRQEMRENIKMRDELKDIAGQLTAKAYR